MSARSRLGFGTFRRVPCNESQDGPPDLHVFLLPGFFGYTRVGPFIYFSHASQEVKARLASRGVRARVHGAESLPVAAIKIRAGKLAEFIEDRAGGDDAPIHLVGHSAGGIDARLFTSPGVRLDTRADVEPLARRVRSVTTLCSPHHGTPLATSAPAMAGGWFLRVLSVITVLELRGLEVDLFDLGRLFEQFLQAVWRGTKAERTYYALERQLLGVLSDDERDDFIDVLDDLTFDQGMIRDLTPKSMRRFNERHADRPGVAYRSVVSCARRPLSDLSIWRRLGPISAGMYGMFVFLYRSARYGRREPRPEISALQLHQIEAVVGRLTRDASDGVVPVASQPWGDIIHICEADHLDVLGHFRDDGPHHEPRHIDWLPSGSNFDHRSFEALWHDVADAIAGV